MFITILRCYLSFLFSDSPKCAVEFSLGPVTCNDIIGLEADGIFVYIFCALTCFSFNF